MILDYKGVAVLAAIALAVLYLSSKKAAAAAEQVGAAINPLSTNNIFYGGVNDVGAVVSGQPQGSWSLGSWLYDVTHANAPKADSVSNLTGPTGAQTYGFSLWQALNPAGQGGNNTNPQPSFAQLTEA